MSVIFAVAYGIISSLGADGVIRAAIFAASTTARGVAVVTAFH